MIHRPEIIVRPSMINVPMRWEAATTTPNRLRSEFPTSVSATNAGALIDCTFAVMNESRCIPGCIGSTYGYYTTPFLYTETLLHFIDSASAPVGLSLQKLIGKWDVYGGHRYNGWDITDASYSCSPGGPSGGACEPQPPAVNEITAELWAMSNDWAPSTVTWNTKPTAAGTKLTYTAGGKVATDETILGGFAMGFGSYFMMTDLPDPCYGVYLRITSAMSGLLVKKASVALTHWVKKL